MLTKLDPDEAVAFAMHFVNAQFATPGLSSTVRMTETITRMFDVIERTYGITIGRRSMSATRFVTHLRYLFTRITSANIEMRLRAADRRRDRLSGVTCRQAHRRREATLTT